MWGMSWERVISKMIISEGTMESRWDTLLLISLEGVVGVG